MQENRIEPRRYYELFEKDTIKFGNSRYDHTTNSQILVFVVWLKCA
jgi:hypothetical protein